MSLGFAPEVRKGTSVQAPPFHSPAASCWPDEGYDKNHTFTAYPSVLVVINYTLQASYLT